MGIKGIFRSKPKLLPDIEILSQRSWRKMFGPETTQGAYYTPLPRIPGSMNIINKSMRTNQMTWSDAVDCQQTRSCRSCNTPLYEESPSASSDDSSSSIQEEFETYKQLPEAYRFTNNFVQVNRIRTRFNRHALRESHSLTMAAQTQAELMASKDRVVHSSLAELDAQVRKPYRRLGENIAHGENIHDIHRQMLTNVSDFNNIMDNRYTEIGVGTAVGPNRGVYICQIYRG